MSAALLDEARQYIDRALGGINTLHIGPLDYNVLTTVDDLKVAARLIEEYGAMTLSSHHGQTG